VWDAILASLPEQKLFGSPGTPPTALASYAGRYVFGALKAVQDMRFGVVGTHIAKADSGAKVLRTIGDGPASKSGFVPDDVITHVDGEPLAGLSINQNDCQAARAGRKHRSTADRP
jgi:C-terminal processing protease CtpA/Prc